MVPTIAPESSGVVDAQRLAQHADASLQMSAEMGTKAPSMVDNTPCENGLEASAQANFNRMSRILKPPKGEVENTSPMEQIGKMVRRKNAHTVRQSLTDDTIPTIVEDTCRVELGRHMVLNSDRSDTYPKVKSATRDHMEQMWHKSHPRDVDEMSRPQREKRDGGWEEMYAAGNSKGQGKGQITGEGKGPSKGTGNGRTRKQRNQEDAEHSQYRCRNYGENSTGPRMILTSCMWMSRGCASTPARTGTSVSSCKPRT